jgi:5'-methylthioadenosine phosphorylase
MHRAWGADLIGMTVMPEAKLAREAEIAYAMVALPTDYDCWRPHDPNVGQMDLLSEIIGNLKKASAASMTLVKAALQDVSKLQQEASPAHSALALAIWSHKDQIPADEVKRLALLWGKYFE